MGIVYRGGGCKMGRSNPYRREVVYKWGEHYSPLMMYGFCIDNAVYFASPSFTIFFFFCNSVWYLRLFLFQIKSQPNYVYEECLPKKAWCCFIVFQRWINFPSCVYFWVYPIFHWGDSIKSGRNWEKRYERGMVM